MKKPAGTLKFIIIQNIVIQTQFNKILSRTKRNLNTKIHLSFIRLHANFKKEVEFSLKSFIEEIIEFIGRKKGNAFIS